MKDQRSEHSFFQNIEDVEVQRSVRTVSILFVIFAAFYATNLVTFAPSIDDELAAFRQDPSIWISEGRWTMYLLERFVMANPVGPFVPLAAFGFLSSIAYVINLRTMGVRKPGLIHFILFPVFIAFPTWFFIMEFSPNMLGIGPAMLMTAFAAWIYNKLYVATVERRLFSIQSLPWFVSCIALTAVAMAVYQSFVVLQATLYLGLLLNMLCRGSMDRRSFLIGSTLIPLLLAISTVIYLGIWLFSVRHFGIDVYYLQPLFKPFVLFLSPLKTLILIAKQTTGVYMGFAAIYGVQSYLISLPLLFGIIGIHSVAKTMGRTRSFAIAAVVCAILAVPFAINVITGGNLPIRTLIAVPVAVWLISIIAAMHSPMHAPRIILFVAPLIYFQFLTISSHFNANRSLARTHDQILAGAIYERIVRVVPKFSETYTYKIDFFGASKYSAPFAPGFGSVSGASFFEWDGGNPRRILSYMKLIGFSNFTSISNEDHGRLVPAFKRIPVWPAEDSVCFEDGIIMVRLGSDEGARAQWADPQLEFENP